jgi:hypothetical protein
MIRRTYVIALKEDAPADGVRELVRVLEEAPKHIGSMRWSRVGKNLSRQPHDLIWDHGFDDRAGYLEYHTHPYHCNEIDDYMYLESPRCVAGSASSYFYDEGEAVDIDGHVPPAEKWAAQHIGEGPRDERTTLTLLEQIDLKPGRSDEYIELVRSEYLPRANERGMRLARCLLSPVDCASEELVLVWEIQGGWHAWDRVRNAFVNDPETRAFVTKAEQLRVGGRRRLLESVALGASE